MDSGDVRGEGADADLERFGALLESNLPALKGFLRSRVSAKLRLQFDPDDLAQSVCREALQQSPNFQFKDDPSFRAWLYTLALRKLVEKNRRASAAKRSAAREVHLDSEYGTPAAERQGAWDSATPSVSYSAKEESEKLREALETLEDSEREIIVLAKFAELSHAEIAAYLGKSEDSCRKALSRALLSLAVELRKRGMGS